MAHGGVETALINWLLTFDPAKIEAHVVCFANPGGSERPFVEAAARAGIHVDLVPWGRQKPVWRAARATVKILRQHRIELLHCHNVYANATGLVAARMMAREQHAIRTLTTLYVWSAVGWKRRALQWIDQQLLPYFDQVTAHCESARRDTAKRGIREEDVPLLICGFADRVADLTAEERTAGRAALGVAPDETVLVKVARFWPEKRHDNMLHAFKHLLQRAPRARLWLPGVGPELARIRALADALGIAARCDFLGFRTDLPELLALADIQVHSSDEEGVPLAILSGMAAGKPIVSTGVGGIVEVVRHDHSGVLVPRREPETLSNAIYAVMHDPRRQRALGAAARTFVETEYSLPVATARVERLYLEMAADLRAGR
jgi:L-malate glycosyltransferase